MKRGFGIYVASRTRHAPMWRNLRSYRLPIISTWIDEAGPGETTDFADLWMRCIREASTARALIAYTEDGEDLQGGLLEIGAALSAGVPVFIVGDARGINKAANHPLARRCASLDEAVKFAEASEARR